MRPVDSSADAEYQNILTEIGNIGTSTNFNGNAVFSATAANFVTTDGTTAGTTTFAPIRLEFLRTPASDGTGGDARCGSL